MMKLFVAVCLSLQISFISAATFRWPSQQTLQRTFGVGLSITATSVGGLIGLSSPEPVLADARLNAATAIGTRVNSGNVHIIRLINKAVLPYL